MQVVLLETTENTFYEKVGNATVNTTVHITVNVTDIYNNLVPNALVSFAVQPTSITPYGSFDADNGYTNSSGLFKINYTMSTKTGLNYLRVNVSQSIEEFISITGTPDIPYNLNLETSNGSQTVADTYSITVNVTDVFGNAIYSKYPNQRINFSVYSDPSGYGYFGSPGVRYYNNTIDENSEVTATYTLSNKTGTNIIKINSSYLGMNLQASPSYIEIEGTTDSPYKIQKITQDSSQSVYTNLELYVNITDIYDNPINNYVVTFYIQSAPSHGTYPAYINTPGITKVDTSTDANGEAHVSLQLSGKVGTNIIIANNTGLLNVKSIIFNIEGTVRPASKLSITEGEGASVVIGGQQKITALVTDFYDNPIENHIVNFSLYSSPYHATNPASINSTGGTTASTGKVSTWLNASYAKGENIVSVNASFAPTTFEYVTVTGVADDPTLVIEQGQGSTAYVGQNVTIIISAQDQGDNTLDNLNITFQVVQGNGLVNGSNIVWGITNTTTNQGILRVDFTLDNLIGENKILINSTNGSIYGGRLHGVPINVTVTGYNTPENASSIEYITSNQSITVGSSLLLEVNITDTYGNPIEGMNITFEIVESPDGLSDISGNNWTQTDSSGIASRTLDLSTRVGSTIVRAINTSTYSNWDAKFDEINITGIHGAVNKIFGVTINGIELNTSIVYNYRVNESVLLIVNVTDVYYNPIPDTYITFSFATGSITPLGKFNDTYETVNVSTNSSGFAKVNVTISTKIGVNYIKANASVTITKTFSIKGITSAPSNLTWYSSNDTKTVATDIDLTANVTDYFGNPIQNYIVNFSIESSPLNNASLANSTLSNLQFILQSTDSSGLATVTLTLSQKVGDNIVKVNSSFNETFLTKNANDPLFGSPLYFNITGTFETSSNILTFVQGNDVYVVVNNSHMIVAYLTDQYGNIKPNRQVTFSVTTGLNAKLNDSSNPIICTTNSSGHAIANLTLGTSIGEYIVKVNRSTSFAFTSNITGINDVPYNITLLSTNQTSKVVNSTQVIQVKVFDQYGNPVTRDSNGNNITLYVNYSIVSSPNDYAEFLTAQDQLVNVTTGVVKSTLHLSNVTGDNIIKINCSYPSVGELLGSPIYYVITGTSDIAYNLTMLSVNGTEAIVATSVVITVRIKDQFGNNVSNTLVQFNITDEPTAGGYFTGSNPGQSDANGLALISLTLSNKTGYTIVKANNSQLAGTNEVYVNITGIASSANDFQILEGVSLNNTVANNQSLTVYVVDQFNNPKPGATVNYTINLASVTPFGSIEGIGNTFEGITNSSGMIQINYNLSTKVGTNIITIRVVGVASTTDVNIEGEADVLSKLQIVSANNGTVHTVNSSQIIRLNVSDKWNNPLNNLQINLTWIENPSNNGLILNITNTSQEISQVNTNILGESTFRVKMSERVGTNSINATIQNLHIKVVLFGQADIPSQFIVSDNTTGDIVVASIICLTANITDVFSNPISNQIVNFTILRDTPFIDRKPGETHPTYLQDQAGQHITGGLTDSAGSITIYVNVSTSPGSGSNNLYIQSNSTLAGTPKQDLRSFNVLPNRNDLQLLDKEVVDCRAFVRIKFQIG